MYVIVWQFVPTQGCESEFEQVYGPGGRWAEFFRTGEGYHGTELWRGDGSWVTVDRRQSEQHYPRFQRERRAGHEAIARGMEPLSDPQTGSGALTAVARVPRLVGDRAARRRWR